ncbi:MAG: N-acetylneuraminate synthase family protein [Desulfobacterales bacterium]|nr:N-acetylneuraminate synthase family protein [Desulfobacterales bacterium]
MDLKIGNKICSDENPLYIAEEGQANQGDVDLAFKMINLASDAGADGIEFQLFWAEDMYARNHEGYQIYKQNELSEDIILKLIQVTKDKNLLFQAACLSPRMTSFCASAGVDSFVINATDLNNPEMLDAVCKTGKPFWLATLMGTEEEVDWAVRYLKMEGAENFGILHGQHVMSSNEYQGVPPEMSQMDCISQFKAKYGKLVGYVDHTPTIQMPGIAVAKGACIVMKHLAPETNWLGPDCVVALPPESWKKSRDFFDYSVKCNGSSKELSQAELGDRSLHRRGLYSKRRLDIGHKLNKEDLTALRPGKGAINPREIPNILGKVVKQTIRENQMISLMDLT